jgi:hypothetical protein
MPVFGSTRRGAADEISALGEVADSYRVVDTIALFNAINKALPPAQDLLQELPLPLLTPPVDTIDSTQRFAIAAIQSPVVRYEWNKLLLS